MDFLDSHDLFACLKGSTYDYDPYDKDWLCLLGKYAFNFKKYHLNFEISENDTNLCVNVSIDNVTETNKNFRREFLEDHTFTMVFKKSIKYGRNYYDIDYSVCGIDFIYSLKNKFRCLFSEFSTFDSKDLFNSLLEVLYDSKVWRALAE